MAPRLVKTLVAFGVVLALPVVGFMAPASASTSGYSVVGNEVMSPNGSQFIPYGVVIECASYKMPIDQLCTGRDPNGNTNSGSALVAAAATVWHANVVRFQVAQELLFSGPQGAVNPAYVTLIDGLVNQANSLGMVAILTLQEENQSHQLAPSSSSIAFWAYVGAHYASNPMVMFDLFNEPHLTLASQAKTWAAWQNGSLFSLGMQSLVDTIRATGARNVIVAEGPDHDQDLSLVMSHLLSGGNIAYGIEPNLTSDGIAGNGSGNDRTQAQQYIRFGQFVSQIPVMPEAFLDYYGSHNCDPNSPTDLPQLLSYLDQLHMGMVFFSLDPGVGVVNNNLSQPTSYTNMSGYVPSNCSHKGGNIRILTTLIGPGALVQANMAANSVKQ